MKRIFSVSALVCMAVSAVHAADVTYDLSGGGAPTFTASGVFADGELAPVFPIPDAFTLDTSTLSGTVVNGIGTYSEHFAAEGNNDIFIDQEAASATFTVNYTGATPKVTSFDAGVPAAYPSGDLKGVIWGWNYVTGAAGSALTVTEIYTSYITDEISGATETIKGVNISGASPMPAPEMDASSAASAMTLLLGGLAVLCSRKRR
jgi:hypothetical protein